MCRIADIFPVHVVDGVTYSAITATNNNVFLIIKRIMKSIILYALQIAINANTAGQ